MKNLITLTLCLLTVSAPTMAADWGLQSASPADWGLTSAEPTADVAYFPDEKEPDNVVLPPVPEAEPFVPEVRLYTASWCRFCNDQKRILEAAGIEYRPIPAERGLPGGLPQVWIKSSGEGWDYFTGVTSADLIQSVIDRNTVGPVEDELPPGEQPTSIEEVRRVLAILRPQQHETFVDYGCGDGRWLIEAVQRYGCRAIGVEINPKRAAIARRKVSDAGLSGRITIITGDATTTQVQADIGVAYLWPDVLRKMKPKLMKLNRFVSYMHPVDGLSMTNYDGAYVWRKPVAIQRPVYAQQRVATWNGYQYRAPVCNSPNCAMCNSIRRQLGMR